MRSQKSLTSSVTFHYQNINKHNAGTTPPPQTHAHHSLMLFNHIRVYVSCCTQIAIIILSVFRLIQFLNACHLVVLISSSSSQKETKNCMENSDSANDVKRQNNFPQNMQHSNSSKTSLPNMPKKVNVYEKLIVSVTNFKLLLGISVMVRIYLYDCVTKLNSYICQNVVVFG